MFFARGGKFYEKYWGRRIRQELVLIVHKEGRHEGKILGAEQCYRCMMLMDCVTISGGGGGSLMILDTLVIYNLRE